MSKMFYRMTAKEYFGFVGGHQEFTVNQISKIKEVLDKNEDNEVVEQYEKCFASLIGPGEGKSFLAGRMAFYVLLKVLNIGPGDEIILPAFTCAVMPNAVWRAGAKPVFCDISPEDFGPDPLDIERKITPRTKMIVAQHSFGIPCQIERIMPLAKNRSIFVLEDSALAVGSSRDGIAVGNGGDAAFFSTDHTKPFNTILGGFFYTRCMELFEKIKKVSEEMPSLSIDRQRNVYQQFLFEYKYYCPEKYGRSMVVSKLNAGKRVFLESDYTRVAQGNQDYPYPAKMPAFLAQLGLFECARWPEEKRQRQHILKQYLELADHCGLGTCIPSAFRDGRNEIVPLRFAFSSAKAAVLNKKLKRFLDIDQFWFKSPVICSEPGPESLGYVDGSCPYAEEASRHMINWPCVVPPASGARLLELLKRTYEKI